MSQKGEIKLKVNYKGLNYAHSEWRTILNPHKMQLMPYNRM